MSIPDLRAMEIAAMAIEKGSMSAAAERLGMTQSAVSQAVKRAEAQAGCALIQRGRRPMSATPAGRSLVEHVRAIALQTAMAMEDIRSSGSAPLVRDLRLGMIDTFASTVGPLLIQEFMKGAAALRVAAFSGLARAQGEALLDGEIDMAITSDPMDGKDGLVRLDLFREPYVLVSPADLADELSDLSLADVLSRHRLVSFSARSNMGAHIARHLRRLRIEQHDMLSFDTSDALLAMVAGGVGVAIATPICLMQRGGPDPRVAVLPLPRPGFAREVTLIVRRGDREGLALHVAETIRSILARNIVPRIASDIPWLAAASGEMIL